MVKKKEPTKDFPKHDNSYPDTASNTGAMEIDFQERTAFGKRHGLGNFGYWCLGLLVAMSPLITSSFERTLVTESGIWSFILGVFGDVEIFFICVTLLVSAACEVYSRKKNTNFLSSCLLLCTIFFALFYSKFKGLELSCSSTLRIARVTFFSLVVTIVLGAVAFFSKKR